MAVAMAATDMDLSMEATDMAAIVHGTMEDTGLDAAEILPWKPPTSRAIRLVKNVHKIGSKEDHPGTSQEQKN